MANENVENGLARAAGLGYEERNITEPPALDNGTPTMPQFADFTQYKAKVSAGNRKAAEEASRTLQPAQEYDPNADIVDSFTNDAYYLRNEKGVQVDYNALLGINVREQMLLLEYQKNKNLAESPTPYHKHLGLSTYPGFHSEQELDSTARGLMHRKTHPDTVIEGLESDFSALLENAKPTGVSGNTQDVIKSGFNVAKNAIKSDFNTVMGATEGLMEAARRAGRSFSNMAIMGMQKASTWTHAALSVAGVWSENSERGDNAPKTIKELSPAEFEKAFNKTQAEWHRMVRDNPDYELGLARRFDIALQRSEAIFSDMYEQMFPKKDIEDTLGFKAGDVIGGLGFSAIMCVNPYIPATIFFAIDSATDVYAKELDKARENREAWDPHTFRNIATSFTVGAVVGAIEAAGGRLTNKIMGEPTRRLKTAEELLQHHIQTLAKFKAGGESSWKYFKKGLMVDMLGEGLEELSQTTAEGALPALLGGAEEVDWLGLARDAMMSAAFGAIGGGFFKALGAVSLTQEYRAFRDSLHKVNGKDVKGDELLDEYITAVLHDAARKRQMLTERMEEIAKDPEKYTKQVEEAVDDLRRQAASDGQSKARLQRLEYLYEDIRQGGELSAKDTGRIPLENPMVIEGKDPAEKRKASIMAVAEKLRIEMAAKMTGADPDKLLGKYVARKKQLFARMTQAEREEYLKSTAPDIELLDFEAEAFDNYILGTTLALGENDGRRPLFAENSDVLLFKILGKPERNKYGDLEFDEKKQADLMLEYKGYLQGKLNTDDNLYAEKKQLFEYMYEHTQEYLVQLKNDNAISDEKFLKLADTLANGALERHTDLRNRQMTRERATELLSATQAGTRQHEYASQWVKDEMTLIWKLGNSSRGQAVLKKYIETRTKKDVEAFEKLLRKRPELLSPAAKDNKKKSSITISDLYRDNYLDEQGKSTYEKILKKSETLGEVANYLTYQITDPLSQEMYLSQFITQGADKDRFAKAVVRLGELERKQKEGELSEEEKQELVKVRVAVNSERQKKQNELIRAELKRTRDIGELIFDKKYRKQIFDLAKSKSTIRDMGFTLYDAVEIGKIHDIMREMADTLEKVNKRDFNELVRRRDRLTDLATTLFDSLFRMNINRTSLLDTVSRLDMDTTNADEVAKQIDELKTQINAIGDEVLEKVARKDLITWARNSEKTYPIVRLNKEAITNVVMGVIASSKGDDMADVSAKVNNALVRHLITGYQTKAVKDEQGKPVIDETTGKQRRERLGTKFKTLPEKYTEPLLKLITQSAKPVAILEELSNVLDRIQHELDKDYCKGSRKRTFGIYSKMFSNATKGAYLESTNITIKNVMTNATGIRDRAYEEFERLAGGKLPPDYKKHLKAEDRRQIMDIMERLIDEYRNDPNALLKDGRGNLPTDSKGTVLDWMAIGSYNRQLAENMLGSMLLEATSATIPEEFAEYERVAMELSYGFAQEKDRDRAERELQRNREIKIISDKADELGAKGIKPMAIVNAIADVNTYTETFLGKQFARRYDLTEPNLLMKTMVSDLMRRFETELRGKLESAGIDPDDYPTDISEVSVRMANERPISSAEEVRTEYKYITGISDEELALINPERFEELASYSKAQLGLLYQYALNETGRERLAHDFGTGFPEWIMKTGFLSAYDRLVARELCDIRLSIYGRLDRVHKALTGRSLGWEDNYTPIRYRDGEGNYSSLDTETKSMFMDDYSSNITNETNGRKEKSFTRSRARSVQRLIDVQDMFAVHSKYINDASMYINVTPKVNQIFDDLFNTRPDGSTSVADIISRHYGKDALRNYIILLNYNRGIRPDNIERSAIDNITRGIARRFGVAHVATNINIAVRQLVSTSAMFYDVPITEAMPLFAKAIESPRETWNFMMSNPFVRQRLEGLYPEAFLNTGSDSGSIEQSFLRLFGIEFNQAKWENLLLTLNKYGDITAVIFGGKVYYDYMRTQKNERGEYYTENELQKLVAIRSQQTQQSALASEKSVGQLSQSNIWQVAAYAFRSATLAQARTIYRITNGVARGERPLGELANAVLLFIITVIGSSLIKNAYSSSQAIRSLWQTTDPTHPGDKLRYQTLIRPIITGLFNYNYLAEYGAGVLADNIARALTDQKIPYSTSGVMYIEEPERAIKGLASAIRKNDEAGILWNSVLLLQPFSSIPIDYLKRVQEGISTMRDDKLLKGLMLATGTPRSEAENVQYWERLTPEKIPYEKPRGGRYSEVEFGIYDPLPQPPPYLFGMDSDINQWLDYYRKYGTINLKDLTMGRTMPPQVRRRIEKELLPFARKVERIVLGDILITSGYRGEEHNKEIGGSKTSQHIVGEAFDFVPRYGNREKELAKMYNRLLLAYMNDPEFDIRQILLERHERINVKTKKPYYVWNMHISLPGKAGGKREPTPTPFKVLWYWNKDRNNKPVDDKYFLKGVDMELVKKAREKYEALRGYKR